MQRGGEHASGAEIVKGCLAALDLARWESGRLGRRIQDDISYLSEGPGRVEAQAGSAIQMKGQRAYAQSLGLGTADCGLRTGIGIEGFWFRVWGWGLGDSGVELGGCQPLHQGGAGPRGWCSARGTRRPPPPGSCCGRWGGPARRGERRGEACQPPRDTGGRRSRPPKIAWVQG